MVIYNNVLLLMSFIYEMKGIYNYLFVLFWLPLFVIYIT